MTNPDHALSPRGGYGNAVNLSWGLVQIPIRLFVVADGERAVPARSMFTLDGHPIGNRKYDKTTGENYEGPIVKKAAIGSEWVELTDNEIAENSTLIKGIAEIEAFIPLAALDDMYVTEGYKMWLPDTITVGKTKMVSPGAAKAAALLRKAMANSQVAALVMVPSTAGGQYVALLPDGRAAMLSFAESVRPIVDTVADTEVTPAEMELAAKLIAGIGISTPVLHDVAGARLRDFLAAKASGDVVPAVVTAEAQPVDLIAALAGSIAAAEAAKPKKAPVKKVAAKKAPARKKVAS